MKKLFLLLALCGVMVACNDEEENKEMGAIDYYIEWMTASANDDHAAYNEAMTKYKELTKNMSHKEKQNLYNEMNRWNNANRKISTKAMSNQTHMDVEYEKAMKNKQ